MHGFIISVQSLTAQRVEPFGLGSFVMNMSSGFTYLAHFALFFKLVKISGSSGVRDTKYLADISIGYLAFIPKELHDSLQIGPLFGTALKGRGVQSGIRVIYAYYVLTNTVDFIEMYFKGESENEDRERIKQYLADI